MKGRKSWIQTLLFFSHKVNNSYKKHHSTPFFHSTININNILILPVKMYAETPEFAFISLKSSFFDECGAGGT